MKITVKADGAELEFDLDLDAWFTNRELMEIRRISGLRPPEYQEAFDKGDPGFLVALAVVAARRGGIECTEEDYLDLKGGSIQVLPEEGDDAEPDPPEPAAPTAGGRRKRS